MKAKIAICQLNPIAGDYLKNIQLMESVVKKCSHKEIKLCIFPEDFLYGIIRGTENVKSAGKKFHYMVKTFSNIAKKYNIDLIPGSFPLYENGSLFNTTIYINSHGKVLNKYRKTNLWLAERKEYTPSPYHLRSFQSILGKTVVIICWDIMDHKLFEEAIRQDVQWVIVVSFWSTNQSNDLAEKRGRPKIYQSNVDSHLIDSLVKARVYEYGIGVIFCNFSKTMKYKGRDGKYDNAISAGHSQILTPLDHVIKKINSKKNEILIVDIPDIKKYIEDQEVFYGRREDVLNNYPYR